MPAITISTLQNLWTSLRRFPWPTITFLALAMSAWQSLNYKGEVDSHISDMRAYVMDVKAWMKDKAEYQSQTIQSQNRLIDNLTRQQNEPR